MQGQRQCPSHDGGLVAKDPCSEEDVCGGRVAEQCRREQCAGQQVCVERRQDRLWQVRIPQIPPHLAAPLARHIYPPPNLLTASFSIPFAHHLGRCAHRWGICTKEGRGKGRQVGGPVNQDATFAGSLTPNLQCFGVFDGHGEAGGLVSNYVAKRLPIKIRDIGEAQCGHMLCVVASLWPVPGTEIESV